MHPLDDFKPFTPSCTIVDTMYISRDYKFEEEKRERKSNSQSNLKCNHDDRCERATACEDLATWQFTTPDDGSQTYYSRPELKFRCKYCTCATSTRTWRGSFSINQTTSCWKPS
eukprot:713938-Prorocentrum_minimum.AAC.1